jgi:hypothetical protein
MRHVPVNGLTFPKLPSFGTNVCLWRIAEAPSLARYMCNQTLFKIPGLRLG